MRHSGAAISENPAGMSPLASHREEENSLEELINFGLWKAPGRQYTCLLTRLPQIEIGRAAATAAVVRLWCLVVLWPELDNCS